jgi:hypothetical protein
MNGTPVLYLDQYGNHWFASTIAELKRKIGGGRVSKMYVDKTDGTTVHTGYVVGSHWCTAFTRLEHLGM